ncbi:PIN domain-containing protein [bacterium]|nr:PIN domain-containing protein [bacterium]
MNDKYFIDTNIFVYSFDSENTSKQKTALSLIHDALQNSNGVISYQVVQEFANVALRKFRNPITVDDCQKYLNIVMEPLCTVFSSFELYHQAIEISQRWQFSFYDSLIIGAALQDNCNILYSEDMQHGQKIRDLEIRDPFLL